MRPRWPRGRRAAGSHPRRDRLRTAADVVRGAVVAFTWNGLHPPRRRRAARSAGIAVRAGHHCAQPPHALVLASSAPRARASRSTPRRRRSRSWRTRWRRCVRGSSPTLPTGPREPVRLAAVRSARHVHAPAAADSPAGLDVALLGLPYDGGVSYRPGAASGRAPSASNPR
jgi:hypothetical protein